MLVTLLIYVGLGYRWENLFWHDPLIYNRDFGYSVDRFISISLYIKGSFRLHLQQFIVSLSIAEERKKERERERNILLQELKSYGA